MRTLFGVAALLLTLLLLSWQRHEYKQPSVSAVGSEQGEPTHCGQQLQANFHGAAGQLDYAVAAERISYFAEAKTSDFIHPTVTIFNEHGAAAWKVRAKQARLVGERLLYLTGAIEINSVQADSSWHFLRTEQARVDFVERLIELDKPLVIYAQHGATRASRGRADLRRERFTLSDGVQTDYEVNY